MRSSKHRPRVLLIEDDMAVTDSLRRLLEAEDYFVDTVGMAEDGIARAQTTDFDVVVTDLQMPGRSGLEVITTLHPVKPQLPIILMTGHHTTEVAIEATKVGAYDYVLKPITNPKEFLTLIDKAVASRALTSEPVLTSDQPAEETIIGRGPAMQRVLKIIGRVAARPVTVLIRGETGTGKELTARAIYQHSQRAGQPFIIVNCVAIPDTLLESELFGHEEGAFTDALSKRIGKFEQADGGTIFLDEIGDINLATQAKLLRVLQEQTIQRVGGHDTINVDVRVLAATHCELEKAVEERRFRADLYYRLNDAVIQLPSLRERREDIPDLVHYFLSRQPGQSGSAKPTITAEAVRFLQYSAWPGNVRELKNVVHKALLLAHGYPIDPGVIRRALQQTGESSLGARAYLQTYVTELLEQAESAPSINAQGALTEWAERELYGQAIRLAEGDQSKVAAWLGVSRPTVRERLIHYGLHPGHEPRGAG
jgi:DNA-binding NtrC family response regulator